MSTFISNFLKVKGFLFANKSYLNDFGLTFSTGEGYIRIRETV